MAILLHNIYNELLCAGCVVEKIEHGAESL